MLTCSAARWSDASLVLERLAAGAMISRDVAAEHLQCERLTYHFHHTFMKDGT